MEHAKIVKDEVVEANTRFLAVFMEMRNSCLVLLSQNEDKLGTLAVAIPKPKDLLGQPSSSILLGDRYSITARMFAEYVAARRDKISLVSIYVENLSEIDAQSILKRLIDKVIHSEPEKEGVAT